MPTSNWEMVGGAWRCEGWHWYLEIGEVRFFSIKTCQSIRPWSDRNEANWGHRGGVRLRLIDDTEVWRETEERAINVWPECVRKTSGERKNNPLIYQEQDAELKVRREGRALTKVTARTPSLFRKKGAYAGLPEGTDQRKDERTSNLIF